MSATQLVRSATRRRPLGMMPGQGLVMPDSALATISRAAQFLDYTGLAPQDVLTTPLMGMPLPMATRVPAGRRRWWGTRVEAMWHPLMWLPARLATRMKVRDARGKFVLESFHEWSLRVALELEGAAVTTIGSGRFVRLYDARRPLRPADADDLHLQPIYDPASGTWLDILAAVGIDIDSRQGRAQVDAWLNGYSVPVLDELDLDRFLVARGRHPQWAQRHLGGRLRGSRATYAQATQVAAAVRSGKEIADRYQQAMYTTTGQLPYEQARAQLVSLTWLGRTAIGSMGIEAPDGPWSFSQLAQEARQAYNQAAVYAVGREFRSALLAVVEHYAQADRALAAHLAAEREELLRHAGKGGRRGLRGLLTGLRA